MTNVTLIIWKLSLHLLNTDIFDFRLINFCNWHKLGVNCHIIGNIFLIKKMHMLYQVYAILAFWSLWSCTASPRLRHAHNYHFSRLSVNLNYFEIDLLVLQPGTGVDIVRKLKDVCYHSPTASLISYQSVYSNQLTKHLNAGHPFTKLLLLFRDEN